MTTSDHPAFCDAIGLTKREYFAAMAMQGFLASPMQFKVNEINYQTIAIMSAYQADALISALNTPATNE